MHKNASVHAHKGPSASEIEQARGLADAVDAASKRAMHKYFGDNGAVLKEALGEALDTSKGSISRQTQIRDLPVQYRILGALKVLCPELWRAILDASGDEMGIEWRPKSAVQPSLEGVLEAITAKQIAASESAAIEYAAAKDNRIEPIELDWCEEAWRHEDHLREAMRSKLRAMAQAGGAPIQLRRAQP
jgi:hypothetical protein